MEAIEEVRKQHRRARHNVYAYLLRDGNASRYSDDGEPQGTAGMPILDVLQKNGLTDVSEGEAAIHRLITQRSNRTYLVVDHSKVGPTSFAFACGLDSIDAMICDKPLPQEWQDYLSGKNIAFY